MKLFKRILGLVLTVSLVVGVFVSWTNRQNIFDWWRLRNYTPPAEVSMLATETTMTNDARHLFYVNHPEIANQADFNAACSSREATIVLGCYIPNNGIYVYNVTDKRLSGVKEVTAAHEMLHAAYDRLSVSERAHIDSLTQAAFSKVTDKRVLQTVEKYRQQDAGVVPNELHSILGTEVSDLGPELETYYSQYFKNRNAIVAFSVQYESEFDTRTNQVADYDKQLASLKLQIDANKTDLDLQYKALTTEKQRIDSLLAANNVSEYNAAVPGFNSQVNAYNRTVKQADQLITDYNNLVAQRNNVAVEVQNLAQAIDSHSRPQNF